MNSIQTFVRCILSYKTVVQVPFLVVSDTYFCSLPHTFLLQVTQCMRSIRRCHYCAHSVSLFCLKYFPLSVNVLLVNTISAVSKMKSFLKNRLLIFSVFLLIKYSNASSLREFDVSDKLITSKVTNLLFLLICSGK